MSARARLWEPSTRMLASKRIREWSTAHRDLQKLGYWHEGVSGAASLGLRLGMYDTVDVMAQENG